ncbi:MAG: SDR family oxidoreductase [Actinomycetota bacterium]|nr:SDR family oxidoreductase [Actinomycetota bacterium]
MRTHDELHARREQQTEHTARRGASETLEGKIVLVTGGGRGLGEAICRSLAEWGAVVLAADVRKDLAEAVAGDLRRAGGQAEAVGLDVRDERTAREAVRSLLDRFGRLDVLINNAGTDLTLPFEELSMEDWDRILGVNLRGPILMSKIAFPVMREQGEGQIVNVASTAAKRAWPNAAAYHASKWGLLGFTHALHVEGRAVGIKVTAVVAGGMRTPFLLERFPDLDPGLLQDPANVAATVRFVLTQPAETVIPEVMVIPMRETSWP